jgi:prepilin peptidase CpaA
MLFILSNWPLWFICVAMVAAAVIDGWKLKVPNWLTFPLVLSGWALGLCHDFGWLAGTGEGGIVAALAGTALGFALLFPIYAIGGMGGGDVKMQMGFGAWIGAFYGLSASKVEPMHGGAMWIIFMAFIYAALIGGAIALGMILLRGQLRKNLSTSKEILGDLFGQGVGGAATKAAERKPRMHLLPYGIPLCLGFISYLLYLHGV